MTTTPITIEPQTHETLLSQLLGVFGGTPETLRRAQSPTNRAHIPSEEFTLRLPTQKPLKNEDVSSVVDTVCMFYRGYGMDTEVLEQSVITPDSGEIIGDICYTQNMTDCVRVRMFVGSHRYYANIHIIVGSGRILAKVFAHRR